MLLVAVALAVSLDERSGYFYVGAIVGGLILAASGCSRLASADETAAAVARHIYPNVGLR